LGSLDIASAARPLTYFPGIHGPPHASTVAARRTGLVNRRLPSDVEFAMKPPRDRPAHTRPEPVPPMCWFCSSLDTMKPSHRAERVPVLSRLFPNLRWRYCRTCSRHFLTLRRPRRRRPVR
jgi:hypothetical protein